MLRLRLAPLAVAAGLIFVSGCSTPSTCSGESTSFLGRLCGRRRPATMDCPCSVEAGTPGCCDGGPLLGDPSQHGMVMPDSVPAMPTMPPAVAPGLQLAPAPRLVPQPQSQPVPYNP